MKKIAFIALASVAGTAAFAAPTVFTDLGTIGNTSNIYSIADLTAGVSFTAPGEIIWFKFAIDENVTNANAKWLDIDTTPIANQTASFMDTEIGIYSNTGAFIATDDDDGVGDFIYSQMTFGQTSPTRGPITWPTLSNSLLGDGRDGSLGVGTYWLAVGLFNASFGATNWNVTSTSTATGNVLLNFRTNTEVIPEPATMSLLGMGVVGLIARRRRK